jgi:hypothetical protein
LYDGQDAYPLSKRIESQGEEPGERTSPTDARHADVARHDSPVSTVRLDADRRYATRTVGDLQLVVSHQSHQEEMVREPFGGPDTQIARPFYVANLRSAFSR